MAQFIPYINFADRGQEQLDFYKSVFGGDYSVTLVKEYYEPRVERTNYAR
jgi:uncharacterized glyoxalase superfamily protein PhnB